MSITITNLHLYIYFKFNPAAFKIDLIQSARRSFVCIIFIFIFYILLQFFVKNIRSVNVDCVVGTNEMSDPQNSWPQFQKADSVSFGRIAEPT